jgi:hypothetical protein
MAKVDLVVGIGAEYKGKPAFNKANKDVLGLQAGVKSLAKAYVGLAGAQKAFRYASQSVKAFAEDDLAAQKLSKTLGNLGLAYEATNVENFIAGLEKTYHVADDLLRPAFAKLISTTQSYTKSKELLNLALNASTGAGVDLSTTVNDLTQAYVGNTRGLNKYKLGLTKAELAAKSFDELQQIIAKRFAGQASQAADTYAFKLNALTIAAGNAKETIGRGITDALIEAFGNGSLDQAVANIEAFARFAADAARSFGTIAKYSGLGLLISGFNALKNKRNELAIKDRVYDPRSGNMPDLTPEGLKLIKARQKADKDAAKRQEELAKFAKAAAKTEKERLAIARLKKIEDKASLLFNMDLIQNTAALMGKVTEDEKLRLKTQQALLLGNTEQAGALSQQLLSAQVAAIKLANLNPVGGWTDAFKSALDALTQLRNELDKLGISRVAVPTSIATSGYNPGSQGGQGTPGTTFPDMNLPSLNYQDAFARPNTANSYQNVVISIDPSAAAYGISAAVVANAANGNSNNFQRTGTGF